MASARIEVVHMPELDISQDKLISLMNTACFMIENDAKRNCPVDTGDLRRSISSEVSIEGNKVVGEVGTPLEYAPYVEFGTGLFAAAGNGRKDVPWHYQTADGKWHSTIGQHPQPYLKPALDDNRDEIIQLFKEGLNNV